MNPSPLLYKLVPYQERCDMISGEEKDCADTLECLPDDAIKSCLCGEYSTWREDHGACVHNNGMLAK